MTIIRSADNPRFKRLKKIAGSARERRKTGKTLLDGVHLLEMLAQAGQEPELLIVNETARTRDEVRHCLDLFVDVPQITLSQSLFAVLSPVETPVGILALLPVPASPPVGSGETVVLLEDIQDPGNLGSILRSCAATAVDVAYLSRGCAEAWSPKALRAGMGAQFALRIVEGADLPAIACKLPRLFATCLNASQSLYETDLKGPVAFAFGNEGAGLSTQLQTLATHTLSIPMPGKVESLNVAAAVAVCVFERLRQQL